VLVHNPTQSHVCMSSVQEGGHPKPTRHFVGLLPPPPQPLGRSASLCNRHGQGRQALNTHATSLTPHPTQPACRTSSRWGLRGCPSRTWLPC
jgi:hypothetical protein